MLIAIRKSTKEFRYRFPLAVTYKVIIAALLSTAPILIFRPSLFLLPMFYILAAVIFIAMAALLGTFSAAEIGTLKKFMPNWAILGGWQ